ncbi:hypothetical protein BABINDRAFT_149601 [Babjeviella inositovora NRRL Y-12698]|uniref:Uncharacterized protein n=1 Tax=Babjeviella inositovora NRRL Y-12698 TaxID=984486 RepID=A0A1E3QNI1_9ASCO|nr:uncharacterized protein BABINDRAFT_149601 [Babjeviella inositovora NRRL Y-12698]ODQ79200.1 hypothetical protein BABINDRAFT_149601 [Babjeviella inositovora NRRL Y-12698]
MNISVYIKQKLKRIKKKNRVRQYSCSLGDWGSNEEKLHTGRAKCKAKHAGICRGPCRVRSRAIRDGKMTIESQQ